MPKALFSARIMKLIMQLSIISASQTPDLIIISLLIGSTLVLWYSGPIGVPAPHGFLGQGWPEACVYIHNGKREERRGEAAGRVLWAS